MRKPLPPEPPPLRTIRGDRDYKKIKIKRRVNKMKKPKRLSQKITPGYIAKVFKDTELAFINLAKALNKLKKKEG